jgi:exonuclease III
MNMKIDFDMKEAKQVTINGTKGEGYAEIIHSGNRKECKGIASFSKEARAIKEVFYNRKKEADYTGIVYDQGKESIRTFTVIITELRDSSGNIQVSFEAKGNPYAG